MIQEALSFVENQLDEHLRRRFGQDEPALRLAVLGDTGRLWERWPQTRMLLSLVGAREDRLSSNSPHANPAGRFQAAASPVALELSLLFSSNSPEQEARQALDGLSEVVGFFQAFPVFTPQSHPGLPAGIRHLGFVMQNLDLRSQSLLWLSMGARYVPSVLYTAKVVLLSQATDGPRIPTIEEINT